MRPWPPSERKSSSATTRSSAASTGDELPLDGSIAVAAPSPHCAEMYSPTCDLPTRGFWCRPTLFLNVAQSARIAQEEIFGPVLAVQTFRTVDEVIQKANNTPYGLSAGVWTDKGSKIFKLANKLRAGVVWANTYNKFDPASPFGGYKESGFGREGGLHGLSAYVTLE